MGTIKDRNGMGLTETEDIKKRWKEYAESESEVAQSYPTLCHPMDCSLLGSSVHGIFQARILEWVAISFSRKIFPTQGFIAELIMLIMMYTTFLIPLYLIT